MNIAIIDPSLFSLPYDTELSSALKESGIDVSIFGRKFRENEDRKIPDGVTVIPHFYRFTDSLTTRKPSSLFFASIKALEHIAGLLCLYRELKKQQFDIAHIQWSPFPVADYLFLLLIERHIPVVYTAHNTIPSHGVKKSKMQIAGISKISRIANAIVVHTKKTKRSLLKQGIPHSKLFVIPHPPILLQPSNSDVHKPQKIDDKKSSINILLFGAIKPYKGIELLIDAAIELAQLNLNFKLNIVGKAFFNLTPLYKKIEQSNSEKYIKFDLGFKTEAFLHDTISNADIVVFPYLEIDASGALSLMQAYNKALLVTDVGVFSELDIPANASGYCRITSGDKNELVRALKELIQNPTARQTNSLAMTNALKIFGTWEKSAEKHTEIYKELTKMKAAI